jgi:uncharacterized membrane protein YjfL (UPF0719 family)
MAQPGVLRVGTLTEPPAYFRDALDDAETLLKYACEAGIDVPSEVRDHVLLARVASTTGWDEITASNLLTALAKLAALLKPITALSLRGSGGETRHVIRAYWIVAIALAIVIVPFSVASFVTSAISSTIRTDITAANDLAVALRTKLGPPDPKAKNPDDAESLTELQQYASDIRSIDRRARQLNFLLFNAEKDPNAGIRNDATKLHQQFELPLGEFNYSVAADQRTFIYQDVRYFAQNLLDDVSLFYGAVTACLLPALYALLGTCAFLIRKFERQMATRTFIHYGGANSARFLVAAIGGGVVGLFNNFTMGQGASVPPLAIAFLVGYAVEAFFAFLDTLLQAYTKGTAGSAEAPSGKD